MVEGAGCRVQGAGCRVQGAGCRVQGPGFRGEGTEYKVQGTGVGVYRLIHGRHHVAHQLPVFPVEEVGPEVPLLCGLLRTPGCAASRVNQR